MGISGMGVGSLVLILVIVLLLFGTKKLRNIGSDVGGALKGFRESMADAKNDDDKDDLKADPLPEELAHKDASRVTDGDAAKTDAKEKDKV